MFVDYRRERTIRRVLGALARQRVVVIAPGGGPWVIERAVPKFEGVEEALRTCELRGWVAMLHASVPNSQLTAEALMQPTGANLVFTETTNIYRLTEAGWAALNRTHMWLLATFAMAVASLIAALISAYLTWYQIMIKI